jgi:glycosyltransferase involved in cell wall biosynthesis
MDSKKLRIAAFGFHSLPPRAGSAGADKFALELYPRLIKHGCKVVAYNRLYKGETPSAKQYEGVELKYIHTTSVSGFDSLLHSLKATLHILFFNTADIIHIHNGGNSIWAVPLRLFGKKVFVSQDGIDWKRDKWSWYGKLYLYLSSYITAVVPNGIIFDNIYSKELFERKFKRKYEFIPYGSEVSLVEYQDDIFKRLGLQPQEYFLFVGRFIPDKGLYYLVKAFESVKTNKKMVLVGGSPNPSKYAETIRNSKDSRIVFPGYVYGNDTNLLMKYAYCYIQPSDVEGLSPVILTIMGLGTPLICSNIVENIFVVDDTAITFQKGDTVDLAEKIRFALLNPEKLKDLSKKALIRAQEKFSWENVAARHIKVFSSLSSI